MDARKNLKNFWCVMLSNKLHISYQVNQLSCKISLCSSIFLDSIMWQAIQSRFSRSCETDVISDIYDGFLYKEHAKPGEFLSQNFPANISFTISTDGVKVFKSSVSEVWPVWLVVNELPPNLRLNYLLFCTIDLQLSN